MGKLVLVLLLLFWLTFLNTQQTTGGNSKTQYTPDTWIKGLKVKSTVQTRKSFE